MMLVIEINLLPVFCFTNLSTHISLNVLSCGPSHRLKTLVSVESEVAVLNSFLVTHC